MLSIWTRPNFFSFGKDNFLPNDPVVLKALERKPLKNNMEKG